MEWYLWFTWLFLFNFWHSRLLWIYHKKLETLTEKLPVKVYSNKIKSRIVFKIKTCYKLELLTPETMKSLEGTKRDVDKNKDSESVQKLEPVEAVLVHCNLVKNDYQHTSNFVYFYSKQTIWTVTVNTEFSSVEVWFTVSKALKIQDNVNSTLIIG